MTILALRQVQPQKCLRVREKNSPPLNDLYFLAPLYHSAFGGTVCPTDIGLKKIVSAFFCWPLSNLDHDGTNCCPLFYWLLCIGLSALASLLVASV